MIWWLSRPMAAPTKQSRQTRSYRTVASWPSTRAARRATARVTGPRRMPRQSWASTLHPRGFRLRTTVQTFVGRAPSTDLANGQRAPRSRCLLHCSIGPIVGPQSPRQACSTSKCSPPRSADRTCRSSLARVNRHKFQRLINLHSDLDQEPSRRGAPSPTESHTPSAADKTFSSAPPSSARPSRGSNCTRAERRPCALSRLPSAARILRSAAACARRAALRARRA